MAKVGFEPTDTLVGIRKNLIPNKGRLKAGKDVSLGMSAFLKQSERKHDSPGIDSPINVHAVSVPDPSHTLDDVAREDVTSRVNAQLLESALECGESPSHRALLQWHILHHITPKTSVLCPPELSEGRGPPCHRAK
jgi:hypothetical protein